MRFFRPEVERALATIGVVALLSAIVIPTRWGYEQRRLARTWRETACAYRLREVARGTSFLVNIDHSRDACAKLHRLGFDVERQ